MLTTEGYIYIISGFCSVIRVIGLVRIRTCVRILMGLETIDYWTETESIYIFFCLCFQSWPLKRRVWLMCAFRTHIKLSILGNIFPGIEKAVITFSIFEKFFFQKEKLMCVFKGTY